MAVETQFDRIEFISGTLLLVIGALGLVAGRQRRSLRHTYKAMDGALMLLGVSMIAQRLPYMIRLSMIVVSIALSVTSVVLRHRSVTSTPQRGGAT